DVVRLRPRKRRNEADSKAHGSHLSVAGLSLHPSAPPPMRQTPGCRDNDQGGDNMGRFERVGRRLAFAILAGTLLAAVSASTASSAGPDPLRKINHIVVIYEENHSFDNLYGGWEGVNGLADADPAHTVQVDQSGHPYACLPQLDVNIVAASGACGLPNTYFGLSAFLQPADTTCPQPFMEFSKPNG